MKLTVRQVYFSLLIICLLLLSSSLTFQYGFHLMPCPLCLIARWLIVLLTLLFALAYWHHPVSWGEKIYGLLGTFFSFAGVLTTGRHLWLLHLPPEKAPACGPSLNYLWQTLPFTQVFQSLIMGSGECAKNQGQFLGLSLPGWTMVAFILLAVGSLAPWWVSKVVNLKLGCKQKRAATGHP